MMPGVVAGFPRAEGADGIILVSEQGLQAPLWGFDRDFEGLGSITPPHASIDPSLAPQAGAPSEIVSFLSFEDSPGAWGIWIVCAGRIPAVPFDRIQVDGFSWSAEDFDFWWSVKPGSTITQSNFETLPAAYLPSNPLPLGQHTIIIQ